MSAFKPGTASKRNMAGACDDVKRVIMRAFEVSTIDFSVIETSRTLRRQKYLFTKGKSWTLDSDHLYVDPDGSGVLAFDLYPWRNGKTDHSAEAYKLLADAVFLAAQIESVIIYWGGFWLGKGTDKPHFSKRRPDSVPAKILKGKKMLAISVKQARMERRRYRTASNDAMRSPEITKMIEHSMEDEL